MSATLPEKPKKEDPKLPSDNNVVDPKAEDLDAPPPYSQHENQHQKADQQEIIDRLLGSLATLLRIISLEKAPADLEIKQVFQQLISGLQQFIPIDTNTDNSPILERLYTCFTNNREKILILLHKPKQSEPEALLKKEVGRLYQTIQTTLEKALPESEKEEKDDSPPITLETFKKNVWDSFILLFKTQLVLEKEFSQECVMQMLKEIDKRSLQIKSQDQSPAVDLPLKAKENQQAIEYHLEILPYIIGIPRTVKEQARLDELAKQQEQCRKLELEKARALEVERATEQAQKNKQKAEELAKSEAEKWAKQQAEQQAKSKKKAEGEEKFRIHTQTTERLRLEKEAARAREEEAARQHRRAKEARDREGAQRALEKRQEETKQPIAKEQRLKPEQEQAAKPSAAKSPGSKPINLVTEQPKAKTKPERKNKKSEFLEKLKKIRAPFNLLLLLPLILGISSAAAVYFFPKAVAGFSLLGLAGPLLPALLIGLIVATLVSIALGIHPKGPLHRYFIKHPLISALVTSFALVGSGCFLSGGLLPLIKGFILLGSSTLPLGLAGLGLVLIIGLAVWSQTRPQESKSIPKLRPSTPSDRPSAASLLQRIYNAASSRARTSPCGEKKRNRERRPRL